jgi:regulator of replication initiation timing
MADVTNELLYEVLRAVQARVATMDEKVDELTAQMHAMRGHLTSIREEQKALNTEFESLYLHNRHVDNRLERIERRLEIVEEPADQD